LACLLVKESLALHPPLPHHIDEQGHASPPVVVENATASNRAVNIPEFVNLGDNVMDHIDTPAIDFYREFDIAQQFQDTHDYTQAVPRGRLPRPKDPTDARPYNNMGVALAATGKVDEAIDAYKRSLAWTLTVPRPTITSAVFWQRRPPR